MTSVTVGDRESTFFWLDRWLGAAALAESLPALHSHTTCPGTTVVEALAEGVETMMQPRLTARAAAELAALQNKLEGVRLGVGEDSRTCPFEKRGGKLDAGRIYRTSLSDDQRASSHSFVWRNHALPKVRFFAWLLVQERIQCKTNLMKKHILDDATCDLCKSHPEDSDHVVRGVCCLVLAANWMEPEGSLPSLGDSNPTRGADPSNADVPSSMLLGIVEAQARCGVPLYAPKHRPADGSLQGVCDVVAMSHP